MPTEVESPLRYDGVIVSELDLAESHAAIAELTAELDLVKTAVSNMPFNPFAALSLEELQALSSRFNNQWLGTNDRMIDQIKAEFPAAQLNDVYFAADLKSTAQDKLIADRIKLAVENMLVQLKWVNGKDGETSLDTIRKEYESIPTANRKTCGVRFRDKAYASRLAGDQVTACLKTIYTHLGISEMDWKR
jgi:hypothetical protein